MIAADKTMIIEKCLIQTEKHNNPITKVVVSDNILESTVSENIFLKAHYHISNDRTGVCGYSSQREETPSL